MILLMSSTVHYSILLFCCFMFYSKHESILMLEHEKQSIILSCMGLPNISPRLDAALKGHKIQLIGTLIIIICNNKKTQGKNQLRSSFKV